LNSANGLNHKQSSFIKPAKMIKITDDIIVRFRACFGFIIPFGISRFFVLGFFKSIFQSAQRLKAIAAVLANTIASTM
jgi:hypothetical protein